MILGLKQPQRSFTLSKHYPYHPYYSYSRYYPLVTILSLLSSPYYPYYPALTSLRNTISRRAGHIGMLYFYKKHALVKYQLLSSNKEGEDERLQLL